MPKGQHPALLHKAKNENQEKWTEIGASWELASGSLTTRIDLDVAEPFIHNGILKFMTFKNTPKPPGPRRNGPPDRKPAA